jgi:hypothetical protein
MNNIVSPDSRGRISLGRFGVEPGQRFLMEVSDDGTIYLTPVEGES